MITYIDLYINSNDKKASVTHKKLIAMGFKPMIGMHDYVYNWNCIATN